MKLIILQIFSTAYLYNVKIRGLNYCMIISLLHDVSFDAMNHFINQGFYNRKSEQFCAFIQLNDFLMEKVY